MNKINPDVCVLQRPFWEQVSVLWEVQIDLQCTWPSHQMWMVTLSGKKNVELRAVSYKKKKKLTKKREFFLGAGNNTSQSKNVLEPIPELTLGNF
jgi:hypothetical protein